jgi:protein gp37
MSSNSAIEWTDATWNPVTGCTKISPGCQHCYAETFAERFRGVPGHPYQQGFDLKLWPDRLALPMQWKRSKFIFVNSMSDLFHKDVPLTYISQVFETMNKADWHVFQVLTKRAERLAELSPSLSWTPNIWAGVSVENSDYLYRIDYLKLSSARIKFLSVEPLLGNISALGDYLDGIDWVIVGGESGHGARPMDIEWEREIRDICASRKVKFFFKQWGGRNKKAAGRVLDGRTWDERPL